MHSVLHVITVYLEKLMDAVKLDVIFNNKSLSLSAGANNVIIMCGQMGLQKLAAIRPVMQC